MTEFPDPVVQQVNRRLFVVREDCIEGGTKRRFLDRLIQSHPDRDEFVYASTVYGGAQVALALACRETGKQATVFVAKRNELFPLTQSAKDYGAQIVEVPMGFLTNVQAKARTYCNDKPGTYLLPFGFDSEEVLQQFEQTARIVRDKYGQFDEVWTVAGSGTLSRGLQRADLGLRYFAVGVGRDNINVGAAELIRHDQPFGKNARVRPPFPSCANYDAKVWQYIRTRPCEGRILFWNVMA
jgi:hypothetical protein